MSERERGVDRVTGSQSCARSGVVSEIGERMRLNEFISGLSERQAEEGN